MIQRDLSGPTFIGIGSHKGGTTWLHKQLNYHPEIWLPPKKELHFFDRDTQYPSPSGLSCSRNIFKRFAGTQIADQKYKEHFFKSLYALFGNPSWQDLRWYSSYYFGQHDTRWYLSLFQGTSAAIATGEITPSYSMLTADDVAQAYALIPHAKIIYLLRHPVERTWSAVRYRRKRNTKHQGLTSLPPSELATIVSNRSFEMRSNYVKTLKLWQEYFPKEQIFIGFYDEIREDPVSLLLRVFEFLGVDASVNHIAPEVSQRVNASPPEQIPPELERYLAEKYYPQVEVLSRELGSYAKIWLDQLDQVLAIPA